MRERNRIKAYDYTPLLPLLPFVKQPLGLPGNPLRVVAVLSLPAERGDLGTIGKGKTFRRQPL